MTASGAFWGKSMKLKGAAFTELASGKPILKKKKIISASGFTPPPVLQDVCNHVQHVAHFLSIFFLLNNLGQEKKTASFLILKRMCV